MANDNLSSTAPPDSPTLNSLEMQPKPFVDGANTQNSTTNSTTATATATAAATADTSSTAVAPVKTSVHVTALDGIVSVNSLFTMAIFIGFSLTVPSAATAADSGCTTSKETVRRLIVLEVICFSFFLFSSLIAQSLKLSINLLNNMDPNDPHKADIDTDYLRYGLVASAVGSILGCLFLTLSVVDFIQVKLGSLSCGGKPVWGVVMLVLFVGSGLVVYICTTIYTTCFIQITSKDNATQKAAGKS